MTRRGTIWELLYECVSQLDEPFRAGEIVGWFRQNHPEINESSLRAHIQSATSNVAAVSEVAGLAGRHPLITRVSHGLYERCVAGAFVCPRPLDHETSTYSWHRDARRLLCKQSVGLRSSSRSPYPLRRIHR